MAPISCLVLHSRFLSSRAVVWSIGAAATFMLLASVGCGPSGPKLYPVSGTVTFQGKPLDKGFIQFSPKEGSDGTLAGAEIKEGKYSIAKKTGVTPGSYVVRVSSAVTDAPIDTGAPGEAPPPVADKIPAAFNTESTLTFEAKAQENNVFDVTIP